MQFCSSGLELKHLQSLSNDLTVSGVIDPGGQRLFVNIRGKKFRPRVLQTAPLTASVRSVNKPPTPSSVSVPRSNLPNPPLPKSLACIEGCK